MEYKVQIGSIAILINTPFPYKWKEEEEQFLTWKGDAVKTISVNISCGELILPERKADKVSEWMSVWKEEDEEIRSYKAAFWAGHPLYAISRCKGEKVEVCFNGDIGLWNHPNMQIWNLIHLENFLLEADSLVLHSCYTMYQDKAILFTAPSGTGKTTQANIWKKCYGSEIINGDQGLLQLLNGEWSVQGYPYHGSADECENRSYPLAAVVIVRQAPSDYMEEISGIQKLGLLYSECTVNNWDTEKVNKMLDLLGHLIKKTKVVMLHCTMEDSAAHVLHDYLYGGENGTV